MADERAGRMSKLLAGHPARAARDGAAAFRAFAFSSPVSFWESPRSPAWARFVRAVLTGLAEQGRVLLGGDVVGASRAPPATTDGARFLAQRGRVSQTVSMRAHGICAEERQRSRTPTDRIEGRRRRLSALRDVSDSRPAQKLNAALRATATICGAVVEQTLLDRLHLAARRIACASARRSFASRPCSTSEPDRISGGFSLGPHVLIVNAGLQRNRPCHRSEA